jgi:dihydrofolate reductase
MSVAFDIVVAADAAWGIGRAGALPWPRLPADLQHFKRITSTAVAGKRNAMLMGRLTWESPECASQPLPGRQTVVISRRGITVPPGVIAATSVDDGLIAARAVADVDQLFVVGGAQIFAQAWTDPALRFVYLTRVHGTFNCDTVIPDLDAMFQPDAWPGAADYEQNGVRFRIERLTRRPSA